MSPMWLVSTTDSCESLVELTQIVDPDVLD